MDKRVLEALQKQKIPGSVVEFDPKDGIPMQFSGLPLIDHDKLAMFRTEIIDWVLKTCSSTFTMNNAELLELESILKKVLAK